MTKAPTITEIILIESTVGWPTRWLRLISQNPVLRTPGVPKNPKHPSPGYGVSVGPRPVLIQREAVAWDTGIEVSRRCTAGRALRRDPESSRRDPLRSVRSADRRSAALSIGLRSTKRSMGSEDRSRADPIAIDKAHANRLARVHPNRRDSVARRASPDGPQIRFAEPRHSRNRPEQSLVSMTKRPQLRDTAPHARPLGDLSHTTTNSRDPVLASPPPQSAPSSGLL
jgi:hypothetical protein